MLQITRYHKTRFWALWDGSELVAVVVYIQEGRHGAVTAPRGPAAAQAAAVEAAARQAQALARQAQAAAQAARARAQPSG